MFKPEDFTLPVEKELRLIAINQDIDNCTNVDTLKNSLKEVTKQLMKFQHLLNASLRNQIEGELRSLFTSIDEESIDKMD